MIPTETEVCRCFASRTSTQSSKIESSKRLMVYFMPINYGSCKGRHGVFLGGVLSKIFTSRFLKQMYTKVILIITSQTGLSGSLISKSVAVEKQLVLLQIIIQRRRNVNKVKSDQNLVSPRKIDILFSRQVMRIKKNINRNGLRKGVWIGWLVTPSLEKQKIKKKNNHEY